jgi:uncharacterized protein
MKASQFNNFIFEENIVIAYNSFSNQFIILDPQLFELFKAGCDNNEIESLKNYHEELFDVLVNHGFIIDPDTDEIQKVKEIREKIDFNLSEYRLTINPTMNCNFSCWYCYESHIKDSKMNTDKLQNVKNFILNTLNDPNIKNFYLNFFGGEPLLYFNKVIKPLVEFTKEICEEKNINYNTSYTSNGFLISNDMIDVFNQTNIDHIQITLDGSKEEHDKVRFVSKKKGSYDIITKNIKLLTDNKIYVVLRINYTDKNIDSTIHIAEDINELKIDKSYINVSFHNVWQEGNANFDKVSNIMNEFKKFGYYTQSLYGTLDTLQNSCYADKINQATINYDGKVYKCTARDFTEENKEGDLNDEGIIIWNNKKDLRLDSKFKNPSCLKCSILPICNGGCSQQAIENHDRDYCIWDGSNVTKQDIVREKLEYLISLNTSDLQ